MACQCRGRPSGGPCGGARRRLQLRAEPAEDLVSTVTHIHTQTPSNNQPPNHLDYSFVAAESESHRLHRPSDRCCPWLVQTLRGVRNSPEYIVQCHLFFPNFPESDRNNENIYGEKTTQEGYKFWKKLKLSKEYSKEEKVIILGLKSKFNNNINIAKTGK